MDSGKESVSVSMIRQFCFCRRIPFFCEVYGLKAAAPLWVKQGTETHQWMTAHEKRRNLEKFIGKEIGGFRSNVLLKSDALGIHGICDAVLTLKEGGVIPLEFKLRSYRADRGGILQLTAYALILEEQYGVSVRQGFLIFRDRKIKNIVFDASLRLKLTSVLSDLKKVLHGRRVPESCASEAQCSQCEYCNFCADRF